MLCDFPSPREAEEVAECAVTVSSKGTDKGGGGKADRTAGKPAEALKCQAHAADQLSFKRCAILCASLDTSARWYAVSFGLRPKRTPLARANDRHFGGRLYNYCLPMSAASEFTAQAE
jgi:hypothetical protein